MLTRIPHCKPIITIIAMPGSSLISSTFHVKLLVLNLASFKQRSGAYPAALDICKHARERERERERERQEGEKEKEQGRGEPTRGERKERRDRTQAKRMLPPDLPRPGVAVLAAGTQKRKKENPGRPRERKGEEEGGRGEKNRRTPKKTAPEARKRRNKNSLDQISKVHTKTHTRNQRKHIQYKSRSSSPKTLRKNAP